MIRSLSSYISSSDSRRPNLLNKIPFFCMGFAVFLVSNVKRIEVRSFGEHIASRLEARKPTYQCELRPQDLRLWDGTDNVINRDQLHDRICGHKMVSCSWIMWILLFQSEFIYCLIYYFLFRNIDIYAHDWLLEISQYSDHWYIWC